MAEGINNSDVWRGVLIEEGLEDKSFMKHVSIARTDMEELESEEGRGSLHFHKVEVPNADIDKVVEAASRSLLPSWYFHLVRQGEMRVVFRDKMFTIHEGDIVAIEDVRKYGASEGILREQMSFERLFGNPYDE